MFCWISARPMNAHSCVPGIGSLVFSDILNIKFLGRTIEMSDYRGVGLSSSPRIK